MAYFHYDTLNVTRTSREVNIPENNVARLMYYLHIVCDLIEYDDRNLDRLRDFKNYHRITNAELRLLYLACAALEPDLLIGKVMFEDEDGDLCGRSTNRIYELSQIQHDLLAISSIFIAGRNRRVKKIMAYRPEWLRTYYIRPMAALTLIFERERQRQAINDLIDICTIS
jgi:hypothetical protein